MFTRRTLLHIIRLLVNSLISSLLSSVSALDDEDVRDIVTKAAKSIRY